jgi:hypothetical protein
MASCNRDNAHTLTRIRARLRRTSFGPPRIDIRGCSLDLEIYCLRCHLVGDSVFMRLYHWWRLAAEVKRLAEVAENWTFEERYFCYRPLISHAEGYRCLS